MACNVNYGAWKIIKAKSGKKSVKKWRKKVKKVVDKSAAIRYNSLRC